MTNKREIEVLSVSTKELETSGEMVTFNYGAIDNPHMDVWTVSAQIEDLYSGFNRTLMEALNYDDKVKLDEKYLNQQYNNNQLECKYPGCKLIGVDIEDNLHDVTSVDIIMNMIEKISGTKFKINHAVPMSLLDTLLRLSLNKLDVILQHILLAYVRKSSSASDIFVRRLRNTKVFDIYDSMEDVFGRTWMLQNTKPSGSMTATNGNLFYVLTVEQRRTLAHVCIRQEQDLLDQNFKHYYKVILIPELLDFILERRFPTMKALYHAENKQHEVN